ncbi:hypothetical protein B0H11DRAFT_1734596 [Mycena galericulata]|nr:hypothetical protein B0H11DRAFT_1734596 [Mycena galericulata]
MISDTLAHAWAPSTLDKYTNGLAHFNSFCDENGVALAFRLPVSEFLLCAFAASYASTLAAGTVENKLAAVRAWHIINDVKYARGLRLDYVLKVIENLSPGSQAPRPPITPEMLWLLFSHLDLTDTFDLAVFCTAAVAFWGQCRLKELLSKTERSFNPVVIPTVANLKPPCTPAGSRVLRLPWTKTKRSKGEDCLLARQHGFSDPIAAVEQHILVNRLQTSDPLLAYRTENGGLLVLTKLKFLRRCNEIWAPFGLPRLTGHCFRIGGTAELLLAGVPPDVVKMMGRWSSDAFLRYW